MLSREDNGDHDAHLPERGAGYNNGPFSQSPRGLVLNGGQLDQETAALLDALTNEQIDQLVRYRDLLLTWNQKFNLTAIKDPVAVEQVLFLDALRMLPALDAFSSEKKVVRLIDIGTGAGLPGLVLKIVRPNLDVTLVEATGKKVTFLQAVIDTLGLQTIKAVHGRAEELAHLPDWRERFDIVTARAVAPLPTLMELCLPFLRIGGRALFPKSTNLDSELAEGKRAAPFVGGRVRAIAQLPHSPDERVTQLVIADKLENTPLRFPRRSGLPARDPLGRGG